MVSVSAVATTVAAGLVAFGIGMAVPSGTAAAEPLEPCVGSADVFAPLTELESFLSCEEERDTCLAMNRQEDVRGNGYIPADAYHTCMQGYWYCRGQQG